MTVALGSRVDRARALLDAHALEALVVSRNATKRYLSGFVIARGDEATSGFSGTLLLMRDSAVLLADARYVEQGQREAAGWDVRRTTGAFGEALAPLLPRGRVGLEARVVSHADWSALAAAADGCELVPVDEPLNALRVVKDEAELDALQRACAASDACFAHLVGRVGAGVSEREVARWIEDFLRDASDDGIAFEPLVLIGARAAMPHGRPGHARLQPGQPLLADFGCQVDGYRSDMTRTVFCARASERDRELYDRVAAAQMAAYDALRPGVSGESVDRAARDVMERAGLGDAFSHGLGHGIGLETHEAPMLLHHRQPLAAGTVFTLEPGAYLPGEVGIRIEDDVVLVENGARWLTRAPRELLVV